LAVRAVIGTISAHNLRECYYEGFRAED
jgi:hypothetical protein